MHVNRSHSPTWPGEEENVRQEEQSGGKKRGSYLMMSPSTGKQEGGAPYYHMPDTQTGRSTVMKTDE